MSCLIERHSGKKVHIFFFFWSLAVNHVSGFLNWIVIEIREIQSNDYGLLRVGLICIMMKIKVNVINITCLIFILKEWEFELTHTHTEKYMNTLFTVMCTKYISILFTVMIVSYDTLLKINTSLIFTTPFSCFSYFLQWLVVKFQNWIVQVIPWFPYKNKKIESQLNDTFLMATIY